MPSRPPLLDHQRADVEWIHRVGRGLLANEPGVGKSRSAIEAFDGGNNLIIAPSLIIDSGSWADQLEAWSDYPERWTVAPYSMLNPRVKTGSGRGHRPDHDAVRPEFLRDWDAVVVDEAHYTKGRKTSWTAATETITKRADAVMEMTGTPIPNWAHEMFTMLRAIFPEEASPGKRFGGYWRWVEEWFVTRPSAHGNAYSKDIGDLLACRLACMQRPAHDPCEHYYQFVRENLGDRFRRVLRDDCLDLPPLTEQSIETPLDTLQAKMYREMKRDYLTHLTDGSELVAWSQGAKNVLLDRLTTSPWCVEPVGPARGGKFERLRYDLTSRSRPTFVVAHYRTTLDGCVDVARQEGISAAAVHGGIPKKEAAKAVHDFKRGKLDVLAGSLEMVSEGLTLTQADMTIFVETSYKPSRNTQALYRTHRMGQERPVTSLNYVTPKTVDAKKRALLAVKTDRQMRLLTAADFAQML